MRVLNLYGLNTVSDLSEICYTLTRDNLANGQRPNRAIRNNQPKEKNMLVPTIQAMAVSKGERNINIFFIEESPEILSKIKLLKLLGVDRVHVSFLNYHVDMDRSIVT